MSSLKHPMLPHGIRLLIAAVLLLLGACSNAEKQTTTLERIREEGVLRVISLNGPGIYYEDRNGHAGLEYELAQQFAASLGVRLQMDKADSLDELYRRLAEPGGPHLAAAGLFSSVQRPQIRFSQGYADASLQVVYRVGQPAPDKPADLVGQRIMVVRGSVEAEWLSAQKAQLPALNFEETDEQDTQDLLRMVDSGELDITLVPAGELEMNKFALPSVRSGFDLPGRYPQVWALPPGSDDGFLGEVNGFLAKVRADGTVNRLQDQYYGNLDMLDYVGTYTFARHLQDRLPQYEADFRQAAESIGMDWRLLAAIGYQESMWQADAVSKTGVRGLMMLTQVTAQEQGVSNRLDPKQSIHGGARHFVAMHKGLPDSIREPDRTWFALAAYNVGAGHLEDARRLAQSAGLNPNKWLDVKKMLPRLAQKRWFSKTRYGYARGGEPVHFVNNIRRYYDILSWVSQPRLEGGQMADAGEHRPGIVDPDSSLSPQKPAAAPRL